jgi:phytanoyl-CoA hydroxylase
LNAAATATTFEFSAVLSAPLCLFLVGFFFQMPFWVELGSSEKAHDGEGCLKQPKKLSINKVGHALHDLDPDFRSFSRSDKILAVVSSLNYKRPAPIQSMYIFKQPGIGGEVVPHQDNTFLYSEPLSCVGLWVALEDATVENGCLWVLPKSHKCLNLLSSPENCIKMACS